MLMTKGMPFCSATCAIAVLWPESKAPTSSCAPSPISFSARERATSTLVSVSAFMICELGQAEVLEDAGGDLDAALAILADAGLHARARQQHADLQLGALRAHDIERRGAGDEARGAEPGGEAAARQARGLGFACHAVVLP